ncbi:MAG: hypothetical protein H6896_01970 [Rhodovulum sp.]|nr:hypothetical protein [Rhodovulum sp.]
MRSDVAFAVVSGVLLALGHGRALAQCVASEPGSSTYTCSGDFENTTLSLPGGDVPSSADTLLIENLTADIGPGDSTLDAVGTVNVDYPADAEAEGPLTLSVTSDTYSVLVKEDQLGILFESTSQDASAGSSLPGSAGRSLIFDGSIDIEGQAPSGASVNGAEVATAAGNGNTPSEVSGDGLVGGSGGDGGAVTVSAGGMYSSTTEGSIWLGLGVTSTGGDGGTGGTSAEEDGGTGGAGGNGGAITLGADETLTLDVASDELGTDPRGAVIVSSIGGTGGDGGAGNELTGHGGTTGAGGDGGRISFADTSEDTWAIDTVNIPGFYLLSSGGTAGGSGHSPGAGGAGGNIDKASGSEVTISTDGDMAIAFQAVSRGAQGVEAGGDAGVPGNGGKISIADSWTISTTGSQAHGIAAYSLGGSPASGSSSGAGAGGEVTLDVSGNITTTGSQALGIVAQSVGGHDGSGGTYSSPSVDFGVVEGASNGDSNTVSVTSAATITTSGSEAAGIALQSIGGGGGALGDQFDSFFSGNSETVGGAGGTVDVTNNGEVTTNGAGADAILAQSLGGAGGVGSSSTAGSGLGSKPSKDGADGGTVTVVNTGTINAGGTAPVTEDSSDTCGGGCSIGIFAQSVGGGGGKGHTAHGAFNATGGKGGDGGMGGDVEVVNSGEINTFRDHSAAIEAQSIGGGGGQGGGAVSGGVGFSHSVGGQGGDGGNGDTVLVQHRFAGIETYGDNSDGLHVQSVGGGGGRGGFAISGAVEGLSAIAVGGKGGGGGNGGDVTVCLDQTSSSPFAACDPGSAPDATTPTTIVTKGDNAKGIFAHSVGGGGGNGGFSVAGSASIGLSGAFAIGGSGSDGGSGGTVDIATAFGSITTAGTDAAGVAAMSVGGGGGNGGLAIAGTLTIPADDAGAGIGVSVGGSAGGGGGAEVVFLDATGNVTTQGDRSPGLMAQSIGGGGGNGGASVTGSISASDTATLNVAVGGSGGDGGDGEEATVNYTSGSIATSGNSSHGILAQSMAGGGGHGGLSVTAALTTSDSTTLGVSVGGDGGGGGTSGLVNVISGGTIATSGIDSHGILAQSSGGGGGYGGSAFTASAANSGSVDANVTVGAAGGDGGKSAPVSVTNTGAVGVTGDQSKGIVGQSIGGAGGHGGLAVTASFSNSEDDKSAAVAVGGAGGKGGSSAAVTVTNSGTISTGDGTSGSLHQEYGILAQSVSGDGGYGGLAMAAQNNTGQKSVELVIGGTGGGTEAAAGVTVQNGAAITTRNDNSDAILAQSIGGNGGAGGATYNAQYASSSDTESNTYSVAIGGGGGSGAAGGAVTVSHSAGAIATMGSNAGGIVAQSIGGGGGSGGSNVAYEVVQDSASGSKTNASKMSLNVGGVGGDGSPAQNVTVSLTGGSITTGAGTTAPQDSSDIADQGHGIFALSSGGGGGRGGLGMKGDINASKGGTFTVGGAGGDGATGRIVSVTVENASITTNLDTSHGILAQSIGGGGGNGAMGLAGNVDTDASVGLAATIGGRAGTGGDANEVTVTLSGAVETHGAGARGIVAQSIGGGGGNGGIGINGNLSASSDDGDNGSLYSLALGGAGGAAGDANEVHALVKPAGSIATMATGGSVNNAAHGVLAQSIGGGGGDGGYGIEGDVSTSEKSQTSVLAIGGSGSSGGDGGNLFIRNKGSISVAGDHAYGILAQSIGGGGGNGGFAIDGDVKSAKGLDIALGGSGGSGGNGGTVNPQDTSDGSSQDTTLSGAITTTGDFSHGAVFQSIGGGGGNGGASVNGSFADAGGDDVAILLGGAGGDGGAGGIVYLNQFTTTTVGLEITTAGTQSAGIVAQSIGGGGGMAGNDLVGTVADGSSAENLTLSVGATGGDGGSGSTVALINISPIETGTNASSGQVYQSFGILAQSIGGGGGLASHGGGLSYKGKSVGVSMAAGAAGIPGDGGEVVLDNTAAVTTHGFDSHALVAQSIGRGGGIVGVGMSNSLEASGTEVTYSATLGGFSDSNQSRASEVSIRNTSELATDGEGSHGILAQSISGGGGFASSMFAIEAGCDCSDGLLDIASSNADANRVGGKHVRTDNSNPAGAVTVTNSADITTGADGSVAILAQAIGGGGGIAFDGGYASASAGSLEYSFGIGGDDVGGTDDAGAEGGNVTVSHTAGTIGTSGFGAAGIYAQSVGAGGGRGLVGAVSTIDADLFVGGFGDGDGDGGDVTVAIDSGAMVQTLEASQSDTVAAFGVFAQSVGGGGGHGGSPTSTVR